MKKLYTFLILTFAVIVVNAQIVNIPDPNFKARLLSLSVSDTSGNYYMMLIRMMMVKYKLVKPWL